VGAISIFVLGTVAGAALDRLVLLPLHPPAHLRDVRSFAEANHAEAIADLARELELTDAQTAHVHQVMAKYQGAIDQAWRGLHERLLSTIDSATVEVETVLDAGQQDRLHAWIAERHGSPAGRQPALDH
jgi:hypothetical protein